MGSDKASLPFGEGSLLEYQYARLSCFFEDVFVSCKQDRVVPNHMKTIRENDKESASMLGLLNPLILLQEERVFFVPVDTPFVREESFFEIYESSKDKENNAFVAKGERIHPLVGVYRLSSVDTISEAIKAEDFAIMKMLKKLNSFEVEVGEEEQFFNINTKESYQVALDRFKG